MIGDDDEEDEEDEEHDDVTRSNFKDRLPDLPDKGGAPWYASWFATFTNINSTYFSL